MWEARTARPDQHDSVNSGSQRPEVIADLLAQVLDGFATPTIIVDDAGRLMTANEAGHRLLRAAATVTLHGGIVCLAETSPEPITTYVSAAAADKLGRRLLSLPERGDAAAKSAGHVIAWPLRGSRALALLVIGSDRNAGPDADLLLALYGLSPAEVRVAQQIFAGRSAPEAADKLCVNVETVRTHLKNVYLKTATASRGELVRLLAETGTVLTGASENDVPQQHHVRTDADGRCVSATGRGHR